MKEQKAVQEGPKGRSKQQSCRKQILWAGSIGRLGEMNFYGMITVGGEMFFDVQ